MFCAFVELLVGFTVSLCFLYTFREFLLYFVILWHIYENTYGFMP